MSADGRYVAFTTLDAFLAADTNAWDDVFVRDTWLGWTEIVSVDSAGVVGDHMSSDPVMSADGRFVAFWSFATNLVPGDTNGRYDVFLHDRSTGSTERVSVDSAGAQANGTAGRAFSMSSDARWVAFSDDATNLVAGDSNGVDDIFVRDRQSGQTIRVSISSAGAQANDVSGDLAAISPNGRFVAFTSSATNLVAGDSNAVPDIFVRDLLAGTTSRVSVASAGAEADGASDRPSLSEDGRYVAFDSLATNLVAGDTNGAWDVFVHDRTSGATQRVSLSTSGAQGNSLSWMPRVSGDGRHVAFDSDASNLVPGDTNGRRDAFTHELLTGVTTRASVSSMSAQFDFHAHLGAISPDGRFVTFRDGGGGSGPAFGLLYRRDRWGSTPTTYCTAKVNSAGCAPRIVATGTPSWTAGSGFWIGAEQVLEQHSGVLFFGTSGPRATPFYGGVLCVQTPLSRTPPQLSLPGGSSPCTGTYAFDFNEWIQHFHGFPWEPPLVHGRSVWAQYWMRDPGVPGGVGLTDGLTFVIGY